jgi:hypothetical protein
MGEIPGPVGVVRGVRNGTGRLAGLGGSRANDAIAQIACARRAAQREHELEVSVGADAGGASAGRSRGPRVAGRAGHTVGGVAGRHRGAHLTHLFAAARSEDCRPACLSVDAGREIGVSDVAPSP